MPQLRSLCPSARAASSAYAAALLAIVPAAGAQQAPPPQPVQRNALATSILGIPFGFFSLEYERATPLPGLTFGVGGSHFSGDLDDDDDSGDEADDDRNTWVQGKLLYYPSERAFRGFSVGLSAGFHAATGRACARTDAFGNCVTLPTERRTETSPTVGVLANYDRIIGSRERFRVGLGVGARRVVRDVRRRDVLEQVYPDGRFVVGLTF
jgi:hypothetical protein